MRKALNRFARGMIGLVAVVTLTAAALAWVRYSRPYDPDQLPAVLAAAPAGMLTPSTVAGAVTVLAYHEVADGSAVANTVNRHMFAEHLAALKRAGYQTVRWADVRKLLDRQPVTLPARPLLLTFDGGAASDWTVADPTLAAQGFSAVAFLTTSRLVAAGTPSPYLSDRQLARMAATGRWEFGGRTHAMDVAEAIPGNVRPPLTNRILRADGRQETLDEWRTRVRADLLASQSFFREHLGRPVDVLAFPYGDTGATANDPAIGVELPALLGEAGYGFAFGGEQVPVGHINALTATSARYALPRIGIRATTSTGNLLHWINRSIPVRLPPDATALHFDVSDRDPSAATAHPTLCKLDGGSLGVRGSGDALCEDREVNTSGWRDYTLRLVVSGPTSTCLGRIQLRTGVGAGHRGEVEIGVSRSGFVIRQRVGEQPLRTLARRLGPSARFRAVRIDVTGNHLLVVIGTAAPVAVPIDIALASGGIAFGVQSRRTCAVNYANPTLRPAPPATALVAATRPTRPRPVASRRPARKPVTTPRTTAVRGSTPRPPRTNASTR